MTEKKRGLMRSGLVVSSMTMMSRVLGLVRDVILARTIGDGPAADAFFMAFKIPQFLRRLFAEGAFSQAFVPVLAEYREKGSMAALQQFCNRVFGWLGLSLLSVTVVVMIFSPYVMAVFAPGFALHDPEKYELASQFLRITFPYLFFISLTGFAGAILNSFGKFAVPSATPMLLNISLILSALFLSPYFDIPAYGLAWGVLIAGILQLSFQLPFLAKIKMLPKPEVVHGDEGVSKVLRLMMPALFGVGVSQINLLLDAVIASFLPSGSVSWLYYSDRLAELPLGVFGVALATVILPSLSRQHVRGDPSLYSTTLSWASMSVFVIGLPASVALIILAEPILFTLFGYGELSNHGVMMASYSMRAYASGLLFFMWIKVFATGYFAQQDTKTPVKIGIVAMVSNMVFNIIFVLLLKGYGLGHAGLAMATTISAALNAGLLYYGLRKKRGLKRTGRLGRAWIPLFATVLMAVSLFLLLKWFPLNWSDVSFMLRVGYLIGYCIVGMAVYATAMFALGWRRSDIVSPE